MRYLLSTTSTLAKLTSVAVAVLLTGCAAPGLQQTLTSPTQISAERTIGLDKSGVDTGVTDYDTAYATEDVFVIKRQGSGDALPLTELTNVNLTEQSVGESLKSILAGTDIALIVRGGRKGESELYGSVTVTNLSGSMAKVIEAISRNTGFFYSFDAKQRILTISPSRDFVIFLPPAVGADTYTGITNTMQALGVHSVYQDVNNRTLKFTSNRDSLDKVDEYLAQIRETRSLLIYDVSIYKVALTSGFKAGIAWSQVKNQTGGALVGGSTLADGVQASFTFSALGLAQQVIPSLLQSYGKVQSVANPRIVFLSGGNGYFRQGQAAKIVTKIGNNYGVSVNSVTVETTDIKTGTEMSITADVADGTIYTRIKLNTSDIIRKDSFTALGTQLSLPTTGDNEINAEVRSRIGDGILLGGIIMESSSNDLSGLPGQPGSVAVPVARTDASDRSELVMVIRPHLVRFTNKKPKAGAVVSEATPVPVAFVAAPGESLVVSAPLLAAPVPQR